MCTQSSTLPHNVLIGRIDLACLCALDVDDNRFSPTIKAVYNVACDDASLISIVVVGADTLGHSQFTLALV